MPDDAATTAAPAATPAVAVAPAPAVSAPDAADFLAAVRSVSLPASDFAAGGRHTARFRLVNASEDAVLHVRLAPGTPWIAAVVPAEVALGPGERQQVAVTIDADEGRRVVRGGGAPSAPVRLLYQSLFGQSAGAGEREGAVYVHLPVATCPACKRSLEAAVAADGGNAIPEVCPYCFERLRPCPVCGAPNSWLARRCAQDASHVVRAAPDWGTLGGSPGHDGAREGRPTAGLSRRWSYPNVPSARRENQLAWSAPAAAYGMVAAAAATAEGDAHLYAFDARTGAPLWEPYPLPDPVYPDRGGVAVAGGRLWAATVDGACVCLDALRGTRTWETALPGHVYGAVVPDPDGARLFVSVAKNDGTGALCIVDGAEGRLLHSVALPAPPDAAPAHADGRAYVHDDGGTLTCVDAATGAIVWTADNDGQATDAAPVVRDGKVITATSAGWVWCRDAATGDELWRLSVTSAPFAGTPAHDGLLVYLPADDGLHLVGAEAGRAVRRHPTRQPVRSAPAIVGGSLLFGCTDGNVYGAAPGRAVEKLYETGTVGSRIVAAPALADGALFVAATNGVLYALGLEDHRVS